MSDLVGNPEDRFSRVAAHLHSYIHVRIKHRYFQTSMNNLIYVIINTCTINAKSSGHINEKGDVL